MSYNNEKSQLFEAKRQNKTEKRSRSSHLRGWNQTRTLNNRPDSVYLNVRDIMKYKERFKSPQA